jgi:hypothetical protein
MEQLAQTMIFMPGFCGFLQVFAQFLYRAKTPPLGSRVGRVAVKI